MSIVIASLAGALLGVLLAGGSFGKKLSTGIFVSARRACHMESESILPENNSEGIKPKTHFEKV